MLVIANKRPRTGKRERWILWLALCLAMLLTGAGTALIMLGFTVRIGSSEYAGGTMQVNGSMPHGLRYYMASPGTSSAPRTVSIWHLRIGPFGYVVMRSPR